MPWFKVDDKLHDHRKARAAGKTAMGVWVLAGSWCMDNLTNGFVPADVLTRWGSKADANRLVTAGLWSPGEQDGEPGWRFHDWSRFQPSAAVTLAIKAKESEAGARGNHKRWHSARGIIDPDCEYCYRDPDQVPDEGPESGGESGANRPVPVPEPLTSPNGEVENVRDDVERICEHLAEAIESNGSRRPTVTKKWRDSARLLLDRDGRTEAQVIAAIEWCQRGTSPRATFWRPNVMSMPKLREKYDQMRLQAEQEQHGSQPLTRTQQGLALARQLQAEQDQHYEIGETR